MKRENEQLLLNATDLAGHLMCAHLTQLSRQAALGHIPRPFERDPRLEVLRERGLQHERAYLAYLEQQGRSAIQFAEHSGFDQDALLAAMRSGADVIVQAGVQEGRYRGRMDLLLRVEQASDLGAWSYEVADTKLAQQTRAGTVLQLCLYTDVLARLQGALPERMWVIKPGRDGGFVEEWFRVVDFMAYYRVVRRELDEAVAEGHEPPTYPDPVPQCDVCDWWSRCQERRRADDRLSLVAGIRPLHIKELHRQGTVTLAQFAQQPQPLGERPQRGSADAYRHVHEQARIQFRKRQEGRDRYALRPVEAGRGFQRLPAPSPGDVFLDLEGDPFVEGGGLEYLFGYVYQHEDAWRYVGRWALNPAAERVGFEQFIDFVMHRIEQHPDMHIFHFAPYEPAALKRLMSRHGVREDQMDVLLRSGRFVDLHAVVRQGLYASVERYSLKELERFPGYERDLDLREASRAKLRIECVLESGRRDEIRAADRDCVERYNRDDCFATLALRDWLEARRQELIDSGAELVRPAIPDGAPSENVAQQTVKIRIVYDQLVAELPPDREAWTEPHHARWLLANLLEYYRREGRCAWWEFFRLLDLEDDELLDERKAICGLQFSHRDGGTDRAPIHVYRFPSQEVSMRKGDELYAAIDAKVGTVADLDSARNILKIKKRGAAIDLHPARVVVNEYVRPAPLDESLLQLGRWVAEHRIDGDGRYRAARDLLLRQPPRFTGIVQGAALKQPNESTLDAARRLVPRLDRSVLALQGPPGSGKTRTGAELIIDLVRLKKRVGITAVSHQAIRRLIDAVLEAGALHGAPVMATHRAGKRDAGPPATGLVVADNNERALAALDAGHVVGGTAWLWAREDAVETLDFLFIDEAGQMSLAQTLSASRAAANLVLLGDPQQLEQPQQGSHPEGAEVAALQHILDGRATMPEDRGLFLDETWRLHPGLCAFTSELFYEGRLRSRPEAARRKITGNSPFAGAGLFHVPVAHTGNQNHSPEEVDVIVRLFEHLRQSGLRQTNDDGRSRRLGMQDVLIVAPYNAQVSAIAECLPGARVGTVDKFQGQEAAIVLYSLASSSAGDAPRGLSFLYDLHRLNVATSRAQCVCILVACDALFAPECRSPEQIRLANALCRYRELAQRLEWPN